uniref:Polyamine transporter PUT1 n=1 Tax=Saccharum hybrid cultivar R570 TaxID=131158 RepID=A0A059Q029_9POAL|nr:permease [Saccharum hybrid cultivar R570]
MGDRVGINYSSVSEGKECKGGHGIPKLSMVPLVFLIFYEVSGAPFGIEDSVRAAGPLLAIVGFLLFALIWSILEALLTAEMGTMFPENGGYVVRVSSALGPFWGFQQRWAKWLSGVIDNALYPVLVLDYLKSSVPALGGGMPRTLEVLIFAVALTYMNYTGLTVIGWVAVFLGVFSLLPFLVMGLVAIPRIEPSRWIQIELGSVDLRLYLNTLFWNLNYWDSISTLTGEVENPKRTLPKALSYALVLVVGGYLYPLITCTAAVPVVREYWSDGYFSDIARILGGVWLQSWMQAVAALSNVGNFLTEMSSDSYQLLGMAERGMLPEFFAKRSRHGTPLTSILFSASRVILLSWMSFQEIVATENYLYCFGMILQFIAFVKLRVTHPNATRAYKVPLGTIDVVLMIIPPTLLIVVVMALASYNVMAVSIVVMVVGFVLQPGLVYVEKKRWLRFSISADLPDLPDTQETAEDDATQDILGRIVTHWDPQPISPE